MTLPWAAAGAAAATMAASAPKPDRARAGSWSWPTPTSIVTTIFRCAKSPCAREYSASCYQLHGVFEEACCAPPATIRRQRCENLSYEYAQRPNRLNPTHEAARLHHSAVGCRFCRRSSARSRTAGSRRPLRPPIRSPLPRPPSSCRPAAPAGSRAMPSSTCSGSRRRCCRASCRSATSTRTSSYSPTWRAALAAADALDLPPALGGLERRFLLAQLVHAWAKGLEPATGEPPLVVRHPSAALALADDLARLHRRHDDARGAVGAPRQCGAGPSRRNIGRSR